MDGALLLTPEEAARTLSLGRTTVYALIKTGELHAIHIGRSCRLSRAELERFVGKRERAPLSHAVTTSTTTVGSTRRASVDEP